MTSRPAVGWGESLRSVVAMAAVGLAGCSPSDATTRLHVSVDTVDGVEIVTSRLDGPEPRVPWSVDPTRAIVIGTVNGSDETRFGRLAAVAVSPSGDIFAADGQALTIRVFDSLGRYVRSIGRDGEGPGEFRSIDGVAHDPRGAGFFARDPLLNRISVFDAAGEFQRSFLLSRPFAQISRRTSLWVDAGGRVYDLTQLGSTMAIDSIGVVAYAPSGDSLRTTLVATSVPRRLLLVSASGQPRAAAIVPFATFARASVAPDGTIAGGTGEDFQIDIFRNGLPSRRLTRDLPARPVPHWAADTVEAIVARLRRNEPAGRVERDDLPDQQPFYNFLQIDAEHFLWVAREGLDHTPAGRFEIFDRAGSYVGFLELPPMLIDQIGTDFIAGRIVDDLGVERVMVLPLSRTAEPAA